MCLVTCIQRFPDAGTVTPPVSLPSSSTHEVRPNTGSDGAAGGYECNSGGSGDSSDSGTTSGDSGTGCSGSD
jgi:hypothetical protein